MSMDDYDGQMKFGDLVDLKLPDIGLTGEENPQKKSRPGNLSRPGIESGPTAWQERMLPIVPTAVHIMKSYLKLLYMSWNFYRKILNVLLQNLMHMDHF